MIVTIDTDSIVESGATTATVRRTTDTAAALTVNLSSDDTGRLTVPETITIPAGDTEIQFDVVGVDNDVVDANKSVSIAASAVDHQSGSDSIHITDDDAVGLAIPSFSDAVAIAENGSEHRFEIALDSPPSSDVVVLVSSSDTTEASLSATSLTFTSEDWDTPQEIVVTGVGDILDDGNVAFDITVSVDADNSDAKYGSVTPIVLSGENTDVLVTNLLVEKVNDVVIVKDADTGVVVLTEASSNEPLLLDLRGRAKNVDVGDISDLVRTIEIHHEDDDVLNYGESWIVEDPVFINDTFGHVLKRGESTINVFNENPHLNPYHASDVNRDGKVTALDALNGINFLKENGGSFELSLPGSSEEILDYYYDVSGDMVASALDSLRVINSLLNNGEGESTAQSIQSDVLTATPLATDHVIADETAEFSSVAADKVKSFAVSASLTSVDSISQPASVSVEHVDEAIDELVNSIDLQF